MAFGGGEFSDEYFMSSPYPLSHPRRSVSAALDLHLLDLSWQSSPPNISFYNPATSNAVSTGKNVFAGSTTSKLMLIEMMFPLILKMFSLDSKRGVPLLNREMKISSA